MCGAREVSHDVIENSYGGAEAYLSRRGGMSASARLQLHDNLIADHGLSSPRRSKPRYTD